MLTTDKVIVVVVDIQGRLAEMMVDAEQLFDNTRRMIQGAHVLGIPVLVTEQIPEKLGKTVDILQEVLSDAQFISKRAFSCVGEPSFMDALRASGRQQIIMCGIETHICVYQTALDLLAEGYEVSVLADAVSSRNSVNRTIGLDKLRSIGASFSSVEMALFEMMRVAEGDAFRKIVKIVK